MSTDAPATDPMVELQKQAAGGDPVAARKIAEIMQQNEDDRKASEERDEADRSRQLLRDARQGSKRVSRTGLVLVRSSSDTTFYTRGTNVINFIEDHGGDVIDVDYGLRQGSVHVALIHYTLPVEIYKIAVEKIAGISAK